MNSVKNKNSNYTLPFALASVLAIGVMIGIRISENKKGLPLIDIHTKNEPFQALGRVEELLRFIEAKYVDSIDTDTLVDDAIYALIENLDPHSDYLTPSQVSEVNQQMEGYYRGLGVETIIVRDTPTIYRVLEFSPARTASLLSGDQILKIGENIVAGDSTPFNSIRNLLQFSEDTIVTLQIKRGKKLMTTKVVLGHVPVPGVSCAYKIDNSSVYIKIDRFGENTYQDFMTKLEKLVVDIKNTDLILDLRGNPGGYLPEATNILCQIFEEKDKTLVTTKAKNEKTYTYKTTGKRFFPIQKVVVLVDENSASASEIIAGALQDWDRGIVIGRRTYGKGLVQEQYDLSNGGAIRLTVAKYYTPSGRSIQRDYKDREVYEQDLENRLEKGDFFSLREGVQQSYASLVKGRKLHSNGGIYPDIFVPADSVFLSEDFLKMEDYFIEYYLINRNIPLFASTTTKTSIESFILSTEEFQKFLKYFDLVIPENKFHSLKKAAEKYLKLVIAGACLSEEEIVKLDNQMDPTYTKALEVLKSKSK